MSYQEDVLKELTELCDLLYRPLPETTESLVAFIKEREEQYCSVGDCVDLIIELDFL